MMALVAFMAGLVTVLVTLVIIINIEEGWNQE